jgi:UrcA family protein
MIVPFGDLDLGRERDQRLLERRVRAAVRTLCGDEGERTISIVMTIRSCQSRTLASAREVLEQLTAAGTRTNLGYDGAKLAFSPCEVGRGRILSCEVRSILAAGTLSARPSPAAVAALAPGFTALGDVGHVYRPPTIGEGPRPLVVLLHGAGDTGRRFLEMIRPVADDRDYIVAAANSAGATWDIAADLPNAGADAMPDFGADVPRIDALLREIFARAPIDPEKVVLVGFSDGASYALSLGLANPDLFPSVVALSPGFVKLPATVDGTQRLFVAHGKSDRIIPIESGRSIANGLRERGALVELREFDGDHGVSRPVLLDGLDYALSAIPASHAAAR